ncbi:MAG: hypothetical protein H0Z34_17045 [Brevibacillus sp.]|nr:hypothetical protein [Brevibacillus sp.]
MNRTWAHLVEDLLFNRRHDIAYVLDERYASHLLELGWRQSTPSFEAMQDQHLSFVWTGR